LKLDKDKKTLLYETNKKAIRFCHVKPEQVTSNKDLVTKTKTSREDSVADRNPVHF
jgi:hypothetical protein